MTHTRRPTQADIARAAGVSPAVVSLVINDRANGKIKISGETQERVWAVVRERGYVPNMAARQLAGGRNNLLGVFTYESAFPMQQNSFYYPFLVGIEEQAEISGYNLLLFTRFSVDRRRQVYRDDVNQLQVAEGAILLGTNEDRAELARLYRDGFPFVFVGRRELDEGPLAYTAADYAGATKALTRQLTEFGHRHILYIGATSFNESAADREQGFLQALRDAGISNPDTSVRRFDLTTLDVDRLRAWFADGVTALAVEQMSTALHVLALARCMDLHVPDDFSLIALGKADDPTLDHHGIDTFYIPHREMGAQAVSLLTRMLAEPDADFPRQLTIPCTPATGRTIGPVPLRPPAVKENATPSDDR